MLGRNRKTDFLGLGKLKDLGVTKATQALIVTATFISIVKLGGTSLGVTITELSIGTVGISSTCLSAAALKVKAEIAGAFHIVITLISNWFLGTAQVWVVCVAVLKQLGVTEASFALIIALTLSTNRKLASNDTIAGLANRTLNALIILRALGDTNVGEALPVSAVLVVIALDIHAGVINNFCDAFVGIALIAQTLFAAIALSAIDALVLAVSRARVAPLIRWAIAGAANICAVDNKNRKVRT